jgi:hypothetical protein
MRDTRTESVRRCDGSPNTTKKALNLSAFFDTLQLKIFHKYLPENSK